MTNVAPFEPISSAPCRRGTFPFSPREGFLFVLLVLVITAAYFTPLREHLVKVQKLKEALHAMGPLGRVVFGLAVFGFVAVGVPRLLFCPIGGMAFGFVEGLLWTQLATLLGYYALFLFVRRGGRSWALHRHPALGHAHEMLGVHPVINLFLIRQLPISGLLVNLFMGVTRIRHRHFLWGTFLGLLPEAIPLTLVGSSAGKFDPRQTMTFIAISVAAMVLLILGSWVLSRRSRAFARLRGEIESIEEEERTGKN